uniref:Uncharacterized protein n=1 Tax=Arundo donax TaxID=35708 RepID=A0A0A9CLV0_ARUDO
MTKESALEWHFRCTGQMKLKTLDMLFQLQLYPIS